MTNETENLCECGVNGKPILMGRSVGKSGAPLSCIHGKIFKPKTKTHSQEQELVVDERTHLPDKLTPQTKPRKCMVIDCKEDAIKYVNDGVFWISVCYPHYSEFKSYAEDNNLNFAQKELI